MVKLPVIVYNRNSRNRVIQDAIQMQGILEKQAMTEEQTSGRYIRPIVLFQAQPKTSTDSETFEKIKRLLLELNIPEEQIAIKTSKVDTLGKTNLMQRDCQFDLSSQSMHSKRGGIVRLPIFWHLLQIRLQKWM